MTAIKVARLTVSAAAVLMIGASTSAPIALADPGLDTSPAPVPAADTQPQPEFGPGPHNVVYRARVDGVARGASITYKLSDTEFNTADPTCPGRMFEATGVVTEPQNAGMQVSIQWPYTASLHCEVLVDSQVIAQADQFVAPRFTPQRDDPGYGILSCGTVTNFPTGNTEPVDAVPPPADVHPADGALVDPAPPVEATPPT